MNQIETLRAALQGVIKVADRDTDEFNAARAALADTAEPALAAPAQSTEPFGWLKKDIFIVGDIWDHLKLDYRPLYAHPDPIIADLAAQLAAMTLERDRYKTAYIAAMNAREAT